MGYRIAMHILSCCVSTSRNAYLYHVLVERHPLLAIYAYLCMLLLTFFHTAQRTIHMDTLSGCAHTHTREITILHCHSPVRRLSTTLRGFNDSVYLVMPANKIAREKMYLAVMHMLGYDTTKLTWDNISSVVEEHVHDITMNGRKRDRIGPDRSRRAATKRKRTGSRTRRQT